MSEFNLSLPASIIHALPTVIVLAAGKGRRFAASGGLVHKLAAQVSVESGKQTVLEKTLTAVQHSGLPYYVVTQTDNPDGGMGDSIAAGVRATMAANGWLILPADMPWILPETIRAVAKTLQNCTQPGSHSIVMPQFQGERGHPVGFAAHCAADLLALRGDEGARTLVAKYAVHLLDVNDAGCVKDVDVVGDLLTL